MSIKHTAGDWKPSGARGVVVYRGDRKLHVAGVSWVDHKDEVPANQRLVCAAPDLLEACQMALKDGEDGTEGHRVRLTTLAFLRTAVAKAIGGDA